MGLSVRSLGLRRRLVQAAGLALFLAGLVLLALGSYSYLAPQNSIPRPKAPLGYRPDPGGIFDRPLPAVAVLGATATPAPAAGPSAKQPPLGDAAYRMVIDRIGVDAGVFPYGLDENRVPQVPLNPWDVAWYDFSAQPGTGGNAVFAGHVTWNGRAVFFDLDKLASGDIVRLVSGNGAELVYTVTSVYLVDPNDREALAVMGPAEGDLITIVTCGGSFFRTGDPVFGGDYTNRLIVRGVLTSVKAEPTGGGASG